MKRVLLVILVFIVGFVSGALTMGYLSKRAAVVFLERVENDYTLEEEILAVRAKQIGNLKEATRCFKNVTVALGTPGYRCFEKTDKKWSLDFPIWAPLLHEIGRAGMAGAPRGHKMFIGLKHGRLAEVLDMMGDKEEAEREFKTAERLMGRPDSIEWVKRNVKAIDELDPKLLELQDIYCYPSK